MKIDYTPLVPFATPRQKEYIALISKLGSEAKAAGKLKLSEDTIKRSLRSLRTLAASKGVSPECGMNVPAPSGFNVSSIRYDSKTGEYVPAFGKFTGELFNPEDLVDMFNTSLTRVKVVKPPKKVDSDLLNLYTISDYHLGMMAWGKESGADWDIKIAEQVLVSTFDLLLSKTAPAQVGYINILGDFLHSDGILPVTPMSGHVLDQDTRYDKLIEVAIRLLKRIILTALTKHKEVKVLIAEGNHDISGSMWLRHAFNAIYDQEPRVTIETSPTPYYTHKHGDTFLGFHHGHLTKPEKLPEYFSENFSEQWGSCPFRYAHSGHFHSHKTIEVGTMWVTQHPTVAARDAYASRNGYTSQRACLAHSYSKKHGELGTTIVRPSMLT